MDHISKCWILISNDRVAGVYYTGLIQTSTASYSFFILRTGLLKSTASSRAYPPISFRSGTLSFVNEICKILTRTVIFSIIRIGRRKLHKLRIRIRSGSFDIFT
uniref:Uncharacterized protein n=1 Tax=Hyaloperonospora arabidopsidis (strain Emoy2) TaxID=559515 RepID=M4BYV9_HYAAE